jgi:hypothetical protein
MLIPALMLIPREDADRTETLIRDPRTSLIERRRRSKLLAPSAAVRETLTS